jgi:hypothetical protein
MVYCPLPFVTSVVSTLVAVFFATTFAPGTTAPDTSVTVPLTDPVMVCAPAIGSRIQVIATMPNMTLRTLRNIRAPWYLEKYETKVFTFKAN